MTLPRDTPACRGGNVLIAAAGGKMSGMRDLDRIEPGAPAVPAPRWWARLVRLVADRFTTGTALGLSLTVGFAVVALLGTAFATVLDAVLEHDGIYVVDDPVLSYTVHHRTGALTSVFHALTALGDPLPISTVALLGGILLSIRARSRRPLLVTAIATVGVQVLVFSIKFAVHRPRPVPAYALDTAGGYSFPSGHSTSSLVIFGVLAWLLSGQLRGRYARAAVWLGAAVLVVGIGSSRVYLGVHHPTDVVAAWVLGSAWLVAVLVSISTVARIRAGAPADEPADSAPSRGGRGVHRPLT
jgi:membrane-associated phospholipid phosphatase